ncbi:MAG: hypothetical protein L0Z62_08240 [Gemmataceae bacterium]|nr:hypothetical protein [Gemmataceae bacterium]
MKTWFTRLFNTQNPRHVRGRQAARPSRRRLCLEGLEDRTVPSTLSIANGILTYTANSGVANNVSLSWSVSSSDYTLTDTAENIFAPGLPGNGTHTVHFSDASVSSMVVNLGDLADTMTKDIRFLMIDPLTIHAGPGNDTIALYQHMNGARVTVNGQDGTDTLTLDARNSVFSSQTMTLRSSSVLFTRGGSGETTNYGTVEQLTALGGTGSGQEDFYIESASSGTSVVVNGGFGWNRFWVANPAALAGSVRLIGSSSFDTLDYSAVTTAVRVNLAAGTATGLQGGIAGIQHVTGGSGNDILIGNANDNTLRGGSGRDLLIGREGKDTLFGGTGDDILIGGRTIWDTSNPALEYILSTWTSTQSYSQRIAMLRAGVGGTGLWALNGSTVLDDGAADSLTGGSDLDWFWKGAADVVTDLMAGERQN